MSGGYIFDHPRINGIPLNPDHAVGSTELDKAVDLCYRPQAFINENARIEYLFELYTQYTEPLLKAKKTKKSK